MRYLNWDILLFPAQSRVPVQEFDTKCHVLTNPTSIFTAASSTSDDPFTEKFESIGKVPILTCFIPSIAAGTPFRISIHSWLKPTASTILRTRLDLDEIPAFQARVYIDGIHHSSRTVHANTVWPEVVETTDFTQYKTTNELLFPQFHPEILQQAHWEAGEHLGRIKIVICEGVMGAGSSPTPNKLTFDRLRDVVAFSFQHAPQTSNVIPRRPAPISSRLPGNIGHEAHAHSPQRCTSGGLGRNIQSLLTSEIAGSQTYLSRNQGISTKPVSGQANSLVSARALSRDEDPFMGPASAGNRWRAKTRSNSTDETMPDIGSHCVGHSRTSTEMSVTWPKRDFQRHMDEAAVDEIVHALSPEKRDQLMDALSPMKRSSSSLAPPANTPKTAEASKQSSPVLKALNNVTAKNAIDHERLVTRSPSNSNHSAISNSPESEVRLSAGSGKRERGGLERTIVTRSQKSKGAIRFRGAVVQPAKIRDRSESESSKRRKISLSPTTNVKTTPRITLRISPNSASSDKENQQLAADDSGTEGVAIAIE